ncbi:MAG TPA: type II toxin-antitoxin system RelE/ParE family toxin [Thermoanaerobaculia bacterium]|nr:type II toxin-antitoxin system RelE/ParE family toxin [Thermoanaerobaculia bacterium]
MVLRRAAKRDLAEARDWYEERQTGLSDAFRIEVDAILQRVREHPEMYPRVDNRIRRAALHRFPYGIFYILDGETIRVIAILHRARSPEQWRRRS